VPLHQVAERSDIALDDLPETARSQVRSGIITYEGLAGAHGLVEKLRSQMLAPCPPPTPEIPVAPEPPLSLDPGVPAVPPVDTTPLPTPSPEPGTNCRSVS
jgi:protein phosphatase